MDLNFFTTFFVPRPVPEASTNIIHQLDHKFNPTNPEHKELFTNCARDLANKQKELESLDVSIVGGFLLGTPAFLLSSFLPFGLTLAVAGLGYMAYCLGKRQYLDPEYRTQLSNAHALLNWALNQLPEREDEKKAVLNSPEVRCLFELLAPLMSEVQIRRAIHDSVDDDFVEEANSLSQNFYGHTLNSQERALRYSIYGYEQGGVVEIAQGLWYLICYAAKYVANLFKGQDDSATNNNTLTLATTSAAASSSSSTSMSK